MIRISTCILIMHALYFSYSAVVGNARNVVIGCQGSQSEFSSLVSDWLELWHIVMMGCVEQASGRHLASTKSGYQVSKLVKRCTRKREGLHTSKNLILNAKLIFVRSKYFLLCETNIFSTKLSSHACKNTFACSKYDISQNCGRDLIPYAVTLPWSCLALNTLWSMSQFRWS